MPIIRTRYQDGSIDLVKRRSGPDVWVYRWRQLLPDGRRVQRKRTIGDKKRFKTESEALKAIEPLRVEVNAQLRVHGVMTFKELWAHFATVELVDEDVDRSPSTIAVYRKNASARLIPKWGDTPITDIYATDVEAWLKTLKRLPSPSGPGGGPMSPSAKAKLVNQMSAIFTHAIRHRKYKDLNPMRGVRRSGKRLKTPGILSMAEMTSLLSAIEQPIVRIAVLVAAVTGLRKSELRGMQWHDVDAQNAMLLLRRGKINKAESKLKTEASRKATPIPQELVEELHRWRSISLYRADIDWVFASEKVGGREPLWLDHTLRRHIRPAAAKLGITTRIGWHTFRRSYSAHLISSGAGVKVVQELMRHATVGITLSLYAQAHQEEKRAAQDHLKGLFVVPKAAKAS
jgi:integrase